MNWYDRLNAVPAKPSKRERILRVAHGMTIEQSAKVSELIDDILMPKLHRISIFGETEADYNEYLKEYELERGRYERWMSLPKRIRQKARVRIEYSGHVGRYKACQYGQMQVESNIRATKMRIQSLKTSLEVAEATLEIDEMYLRSLQKGE